MFHICLIICLKRPVSFAVLLSSPVLLALVKSINTVIDIFDIVHIQYSCDEYIVI